MRIKYFVDEKNRTIVCVLDNCAFAVINWLDGRHPWILSNVIEDKLVIPNKFVGIARCAEGDTWNESYGRQLAYFRAKQKFDRAFARGLMRYKTSMRTALSRMEALADQKVGKLEITEDKYGRKLFHK